MLTTRDGNRFLEGRQADGALTSHEVEEVSELETLACYTRPRDVSKQEQRGTWRRWSLVLIQPGLFKTYTGWMSSSPGPSTSITDRGLSPHKLAGERSLSRPSSRNSVRSTHSPSFSLDDPGKHIQPLLLMVT